MRLRHRTVRAPRARQPGRKGASGRQRKAAGRPVRGVRPPPGFAAAADSTDSDADQLLSEGEERGEDEADLLLQLAHIGSGGQQEQQEQQVQPWQPVATPALPLVSTHPPAPSSEARWLVAMALSPLLSLPRLQPETEEVGVWAAPSSMSAALPTASPEPEAAVASPTALPSPAFHDFGGPSLPPRHPLWGSQPVIGGEAAVAAPKAGRAPVGAGPLVSDGSGRAGVAAAAAAMAHQAALAAARGGTASPPVHPWDLRRPAERSPPLQLQDVQQLQPPDPAAAPAQVPVPASEANPKPYHLFASGTTVPFQIPLAQFNGPQGEAVAAAAVHAAFATAASDPSPRSTFTATYYSAGSSLAARHTRAPLFGRPQRYRRQRELSAEFHWSHVERREGGERGLDSETDEDEEGTLVASDDSDEEGTAQTRSRRSSRSSHTSAAPSNSGRSRSGRSKGGQGGDSLQQHVQHAAMAKRVKELLNLAAPEAATVLGLSTTRFRRLCRSVGIPRWPNRRPASASDE